MIRSLLVSVLLLTGCEAKAKPVVEQKFATRLTVFQASWCGPCHKMEPVLKSIEKKGFIVHRIDVDKFPDLASQFKITKVPTFVILKAGKEVHRISGVVKEKVLIMALRDSTDDMWERL